MLDDVMKREFGFRGYIMTDWSAQHSTMSAAVGLDVRYLPFLSPHLFILPPYHLPIPLVTSCPQLTDVFYVIDVHAGRYHVLLWYILVGPEPYRFRSQWYDRPSKTRRHGDKDLGVVGISGARRG